MTTAPSTGTPKAAKTAAPRTRPTGTGPTGAKATGPATPTRRTLEQHLETIAAGEVMTPADLHEFLESLRALSQGMAFLVHAAASQISIAARQGARQNTDGRMTMAQKARMVMDLRKMGRLLDTTASESLLSTATGAAKTWAIMEDFLESLESEHVNRPHRAARGGFDPFGGK